jgi:flavin reductase (DIM6/NTAB) family NADH-FMN oxidoreductase RutF
MQHRAACGQAWLPTGTRAGKACVRDIVRKASRAHSRSRSNEHMTMNPHFRPVALEHASRLINHGPTVLVTSAAGSHRNVMAAAWSMPVEFTPPRIAVVIDKHTFTRGLVMASGAFGLCLPGAALVDLTYAVGGESGRSVDKFARHGITAINGPVLGVPLIEAGCAAWLECRLIREEHAEDAYDTCFAEVVAAAADERIFANGHWLFTEDNAELQTIHHLGAGNFVRAGGVLRARALQGPGA